MQFSPLRQQTTPEAAVDALREAILSGALPQGSQLREVHIATEMGISRAPLREALRTLEEAGLVVKIPFRGTFVAQVSADTMAEINSLRTHLEPYAVERSLPKLLGSEAWRLDGATEALEATVRAGDIGASVETHLALHRLFYEHADHRLLLRMWHEWESQLRLFFGADHAAFGHLDRIYADHHRLVAVVKTGDLAAITAELVEHISARYMHENEAAPAPDSDVATLEKPVG